MISPSEIARTLNASLVVYISRNLVNLSSCHCQKSYLKANYYIAIEHLK